MTDALNGFFQCVETAHGWEFQVAVVGWVGQKPEVHWKAYRRWKTQPDAVRLSHARESALDNPRFFQTCSRCGELNNVGHMHDRETCQACAVRDLGVVY